MTIKKAVVIGSGVMGSGIAAQLANAGIEVELLDILPRDIKDGDDRDIIAKSAIAKLQKDTPAPLMHKKNAKLIRAGNLEDHLHRIKDADLIIEAVIERPDIKSEVFKKIDAHRKSGSIVGSNTSTIPLKKLAEDQSDALKKDLVITHFFNPPRYMPLLELVTSNDNDPASVKKITEFMDETMGKTVIKCKDTPGFIANRIGTYWLTVAMNKAMEAGLTPEEADAIAGKPLGVPKSGIFGLVDMVGLDLMPHISDSLLRNVPHHDHYHKVHKDVPLINKMMENGYIGLKGKGGFYRLNTKNGKKQKEVIDLYAEDITYRAVQKPKVKSTKRAKKGIKNVIKGKDAESQYAWEVFKNTMLYAATLVPQINDDIAAIDDAMKLGYNWKHGPFEMLDKVGVNWFIKHLHKEDIPIPPLLRTAEGRKFYKTKNGVLNTLQVDGSYKPVKRPDGVLLLSDIKRGSKPVASNPSAKLWDIGDGVLCLEFTSPSNAIDPLVMSMINKANKIISRKKGPYKALVIHNEGTHFSVGANIMLAKLAGEAKQYWAIDRLVKNGQDTYRKLKFSPFPVVGAAHGMALGGGCEILLHCDSIQAHAETYMGLVEMGVGIIPGWGGCAEMLKRANDNQKRAQGPMPPIAETFEKIATAKVSLSAAEAKALKYIGKNDGVTMNKSRLLADAKAKALSLVDGYTPPKPTVFRLPGASGRATLQMAVNDMYERGLVSSYGVVLADQLAEVLTGGPNADITREVTEDDIRALERQAFKRLARDPRTAQRIKHMLSKGKPLDQNKNFLKADRSIKGDVSISEVRGSLKGSVDLNGKKNTPSKTLMAKLAPSFKAASMILKKPKKAKQAKAPQQKSPKK